ncbi:hypothetical protein MSAN_00683400 [Mycena sanguinolenta]|uniref:F-box domain-containing protein n=1 Tax=Mycena sanguinolenta TaxID=230812 RepID=A0A8H6Z0Q5_9AGAR|nr:hypothetical protein MSAN_00683400 [Mycena sanguinolenta]
MHPVLLLDDVLRQMFDFCPKSSLPVVARTCKSWKDPALDCVWSHLGSLVPLLRLIPGLICVDGVYNVEGPLHLGVFNSYAYRIQHITQRHNTRLHPKILHVLCANGTPLTRLTTTRLSSTDLDCVPAALSLSAGLRQLDLDFGFKRKEPGMHDDYIETLIRVATNVERVRLRGLADQRLNSAISQMSNLCSLSLRTGPFLTAETLAAISTFPSLSELEIEAGHIDIDTLVEAWSLSSTCRDSAPTHFRALKKLHICAQAPLLELVLKTIPPYLHTLRIEATTPAGSPPVDWSSLFDVITTHAIHDLTIEQHLDDIDLDTTAATSTSANTQHSYSNNRITFDLIRRLAPLRYLHHLTIDTTFIPILSDQDIEALAAWWPDLAHLDLGSLHSSECLPSTGSPPRNVSLFASFRLLDAEIANPHFAGRPQRRTGPDDLRHGVQRVVESHVLIFRSS